MKLWRGEPEHGHWRALITRRDRAIGSLVFGLLAIGYAVLKLFQPASSCGESGRFLCSIAHAVSSALSIPLFAAESALWGGLGLAFVVLGAAYWRAG
jgi:hypothetical protein